MKATLDGIEAKIERAELHRRDLSRGYHAYLKTEPYRFVPEVHDNGTKHIYRVAQAEPLAPALLAAAGDCIHNLRSALDHLAWQLVIANRGTPTEITSFPAWRSRTRTNPRTGIVEYVTVRGGVDPTALSLIEQIQPYQRRHNGDAMLLWQLHELDVIDKHRHLPVTVGIVSSAMTKAGLERPHFDAVPHFPRRRGGLKEGQIAAIVSCNPPRAKPDPDLKFLPFITFEERFAFAPGHDLPFILWGFGRWIENVIVPRFRPFLSLPEKGAERTFPDDELFL